MSYADLGISPISQVRRRSSTAEFSVKNPKLPTAFGTYFLPLQVYSLRKWCEKDVLLHLNKNRKAAGPKKGNLSRVYLVFPHAEATDH
jgi:hypothetical protein